MAEAHIALEVDKWKRFDQPDLGAEYEYVRFDFGPHTKIAYGRLFEVEIYVGNESRVFIEEGRFKPRAARVVGFPSTKLQGSEEFATRPLYLHPDGLWIAPEPIGVYRGTDDLYDLVDVPFEHISRDLMTAGDANQIQRNDPLGDLENRIASLNRLKSFLESKGAVFPSEK